MKTKEFWIKLGVVFLLLATILILVYVVFFSESLLSQQVQSRLKNIEPTPVLVDQPLIIRPDQGISTPSAMPSGGRKVTIGGKLTGATRKNGIFSLEIAVPYQGETFQLIVDLGTAKMQIGEIINTAEVDQVVGQAQTYSSQSSGETKTVDEIYAKYKNKIGEVIGFDLVTDATGIKLREGCDACQERLDFFVDYASTNILLEDPAGIPRDQVLRLGGVIDIID